jgi:hypothetical protein
MLVLGFAPLLLHAQRGQQGVRSYVFVLPGPVPSASPPGPTSKVDHALDIFENGGGSDWDSEGP